MLTATPTPWVFVKDGSLGSIQADDGGRRVRIFDVSGSIYNPEIDKDAAGATHAVNCYDEMLGALIQVRARLTGFMLGLDEGATVERVNRAIEKAKSAE